MAKKDIVSVHVAILFLAFALLLYFSDKIMLLIYPDYGNDTLWIYTIVLGTFILILLFGISLILYLKAYEKQKTKKT